MYYQLNIDYIIETYCINKDKPQLQCNGKCHLAKQLATTTPVDEEGKAILNLMESFFPVFSEKSLILNLEYIEVYIAKQRITSYNQIYSYDFDYSHFKPPIV